VRPVPDTQCFDKGHYRRRALISFGRRRIMLTPCIHDDNRSRRCSLWLVNHHLPLFDRPIPRTRQGWRRRWRECTWHGEQHHVLHANAAPSSLLRAHLVLRGCKGRRRRPIDRRLLMVIWLLCPALRAELVRTTASTAEHARTDVGNRIELFKRRLPRRCFSALLARPRYNIASSSCLTSFANAAAMAVAAFW